MLIFHINISNGRYKQMTDITATAVQVNKKKQENIVAVDFGLKFMYYI